jgi:hypothetical protein
LARVGRSGLLQALDDVAEPLGLDVGEVDERERDAVALGAGHERDDLDGSRAPRRRHSWGGLCTADDHRLVSELGEEAAKGFAERLFVLDDEHFA